MARIAPKLGTRIVRRLGPTQLVAPVHNWGLAALLGKTKTHVLQGFAASQAGYHPSIVHKGLVALVHN
jgi:hypothetical protein